MVNSILSNSGLKLGQDYELSSEVVDENLKKLVKEEILKFYKK